MISYEAFSNEMEKIAGLRDAVRYALTGRVALRHGTSSERKAEAQKGGLVPQGSPGISKEIGLDKAENGLAFTTRSPMDARTYSMQQAGLNRVDRLRGLLGKFNNQKARDLKKHLDTPSNRVMAARHLGLIPGGKGVVEARVPIHQLKEGVGRELHVNPYLQAQRAGLKAIHPALEQAAALPFVQHVPVEGGVPAKYIKGSPHYQGVSLPEVGAHLKDVVKNPKFHAKETLRSLLNVQHRPQTLINQEPEVPGRGLLGNINFHDLFRPRVK